MAKNLKGFYLHPPPLPFLGFQHIVPSKSVILSPSPVHIQTLPPHQPIPHHPTSPPVLPLPPILGPRRSSPTRSDVSNLIGARFYTTDARNGAGKNAKYRKPKPAYAVREISTEPAGAKEPPFIPAPSTPEDIGRVTLGTFRWVESVHSMRIVVEFELMVHGTPVHKLGLVRQPFMNNVWCVISAQGKEILVDTKNITFQFPLGYDFLSDGQQEQDSPTSPLSAGATPQLSEPTSPKSFIFGGQPLEGQYTTEELSTVEMLARAMIDAHAGGRVRGAWSRACALEPKGSPITSLQFSQLLQPESKKISLPTPLSVYVSHCLMRCNPALFTRVAVTPQAAPTSASLPLPLPTPLGRMTPSYRPIREEEVREQEEKERQARESKKDDELFAIRVAHKLISDQATEFSPAFSALAQKHSLVTSDLSWDPARDSSRLAALKRYALGTFFSSPSSAPGILSTPPSPRGPQHWMPTSPTSGAPGSLLFLEQQEPFNVFSRLLEPLGLQPHPSSAFDLCLRLGVISQHENIHLARALARRSIRTEFGEETDRLIEAMANGDVHPDPDHHTRRDLRHLRVFAIDDASTQEVDDGVSIEKRADGSTWVYIHIADVTRYISLNSHLDNLACSRSKTLYLPESTVFMLPRGLSVDLASLSPERDTHTLTFAARVYLEGEQQQAPDQFEYELYPGLISKVERLTYEQVDDIVMEGDKCTDEGLKAALESLYAVARARFAQRTEQGGALQFASPKPQIKVVKTSEKDEEIESSEKKPASTAPFVAEYVDEEIRVTLSTERSQNAPSQVLVSELMILAGEVCAKYASSRNICIPYRTQERPFIPPPTMELLRTINHLPPPVPTASTATTGSTSRPSSPTNASSDVEAADSLGAILRAGKTKHGDPTPMSPSHLQSLLLSHDILKFLAPAKVSFSPAAHAGLGLSAYTQVTSPIRRYSDLLCHHQIKAAMRGHALLSPAKLMEKLSQSDPQSAIIEQLQKDSNRFWALKFLALCRERWLKKGGERPIFKSLILDCRADYQGMVATNGGVEAPFTGNVVLLDIGFKTRSSFDQPLQRGEVVDMEVAHVVPHQDVLVLKRI